MNEGTKELIRLKLPIIIIALALLVVLLIVTVSLEVKIKKTEGSTKGLEQTNQELTTENQKLKEQVSSLTDENESLSAECKKWKELLTEEHGENYIKEIEYFDKIEAEASTRLSYNDKAVKDFPGEEILKTVNDYVTIAELYENSTAELFVKLGLANKKKVENYSSLNVPGGYYLTDIKFDDLKNEMLEYMTEDCLIENFTKFKSKDGTLYCYINDEEIPNVEITQLEVQDDNTFIATVKAQSEGEEDSTYEFTLTSLDGKLLVADTNY